MPTITVMSTQQQQQVEPRRLRPVLASDKSKNPFQADLRKNDDLRWFGVESLFPLEISVDPPPTVAVPSTTMAISRVDSYRVPPLKMTLETILEDKPPELLFLVRSKSLPTQRRDHNAFGLCKMPSYRHGNHLGVDRGTEDGGDGSFFAGDGTYFAGDDRGGFDGGYGVSMSGPVLSTPGVEYAKSYYRRSPRFPRVPFARLREAIRRSRLRGAVSQLLSRFRPSSRRSH